MTSSAVRSKAVALLLLIRCLLLLPLFVGFCVRSFISYAAVCSVKNFQFCNHLAKKEKAGCFTFIDLLLSFGCKLSVSLHHGALGCSAVGDCGIPGPTHFPFFHMYVGC